MLDENGRKTTLRATALDLTAETTLESQPVAITFGLLRKSLNEILSLYLPSASTDIYDCVS